MADIRLTCPMCATENIFSEYSEEDARSCRSCGIALSPPVTDPIISSESSRPALHIRERTSRKPPPLPVSGAVVPTAGRAGSAVNIRKEGGRSRWTVPLSLILFSLLFVGPQVLLPRFPQWSDFYLYGRYAALALGLLLILADAFRESMGQGALCLLLPFYIVYYGLTRVESYWRQGLTLAILAMTVAELHFLPEHAMIREFSGWLSAQIESVERLIQRAGEAPLQ